MIPLSALPIIIRGKLLIPKFLYPRHVSLVASLIEIVDELTNRNLTESNLKRIIESFIGDYRISKALHYALRYFYEFKTVGLDESTQRYLAKKHHIQDEWEFKKAFYRWVNEKGGFLGKEERDFMIRRFAKEIGLSYDIVKRVIENELPENITFMRKRDEKPRPLVLIGLYNFLLLEKLLSISERAFLNVYGRELGAIVKKLILRAKRHDVIADFKKVKNGVEVEITGPYQLFKLPAVSEYGRQIAAVIAPIIVNYEGWRLRLWVIYRKRRYYCEIRGYEENSPILKPYWAIASDEKPRETYDSSIEERIYNALSKILERNNARILREADVIILNNGRILIPDFTVVWGKKKIFIEVIGYWRREYIEKKKEKLIELSKEGYKNFLAVIDEKLRKHFDQLPIYKIYYSGNYIPIGKLYRLITSI